MNIEELKLYCSKSVNSSFIEKVLKDNNCFQTVSHITRDDVSIKEKFYRYIHDIPDGGKCKLCGRPTKFNSFDRGYKDFCCLSCSRKYNEEKIQETKLKRYGDRFYTNRNKAKTTNLKKYGQEYYTNRNKAEETMLSRYGIYSYFLANEFNSKRIDTFKKKYGVEHPMQSISIQEKHKASCIETFGVEHPMQSDLVKEKHKISCLESLGVEYPMQSDLCKSKAIFTFRKNNLEEFKHILTLKKYSLFSEEDFILKNEDFYIKCNLCYNIFKSSSFSPLKFGCDCRKHISIGERDLAEFIKSLNPFEIEENDRCILEGKELDIYIPEHKLAIEYNGLYWHCELEKDKDYHLNKTLECKEKGIQLIHIFESEWKDELKQEIVKSIIKAKLGIFDERIYARKCIVKEISQQIYNEFLMLNHLQGSCVSKVRIGLYYKDELVSVMGFGKSRFKKGEIELIRFANKLNTSVVGGFSKLLKYYMVQYKPDNIISYCDLRYFDGSGYLKNGFEVISRSKPNYFYWKYNDKNYILYNRQYFQKHKLKEKLEIYDESISEHTNMLNNKYVRIYDCGNLVLKFNKG